MRPCILLFACAHSRATNDRFGEVPGAERYSTGAPFDAIEPTIGSGPDGSINSSNRISAQARMPAGLGVRFQCYHLTAKHRVFGYDQLAIGVDRMEQSALNSLARLDWIGRRYFNLQTCSFRELRLSIKPAAASVHLGVPQRTQEMCTVALHLENWLTARRT